ncbi:MAG: hypothetical protein AB1714_22865 [Acidobacteriota bacterium]
MERSPPSDLAPDETASIVTAIEGASTEIARLLEQMTRDQAEIERLKDETRAILEDLKAA